MTGHRGNLVYSVKQLVHTISSTVSCFYCSLLNLCEIYIQETPCLYSVQLWGPDCQNTVNAMVRVVLNNPLSLFLSLAAAGTPKSLSQFPLYNNEVDFNALDS
jgi:hypothetical protein